ncbi:MAG: ribose-phosphate diphosphokinase [Propioniciclava sp.]
MRDIAVFSGSAHPALVAEICSELDLAVQPSRVTRFANDCLEVQLEANCRERDVFLIQPLVAPVQEHLVELMLMIDAARGASAGRVTVVMPHYAYARSDKKDAPRISIGARLMADLLVASGADRMLMMTLHSPQVHGFFSVPVDHLNALRELAAHFAQQDLSNTVVVSPDLGNVKEAAAFARMLGVPVAAGAKQRFPDDRVAISSVIGEIEGREVIVLDDEIAKGSTVLELIRVLRDQGVQRIQVACTHGLFAGQALQRIGDQPEVTGVVCTNTVPLDQAEVASARPGLLTVLSIAPVVAETIRRIHDGESVSSLFDRTTPVEGRSLF